MNIAMKAFLFSIGTGLIMICMWLDVAAVYPPSDAAGTGSNQDYVHRKRQHRLQTRNTTLSVNATNACTNNKCMHNSTCIIDATGQTHCNCTTAKVGASAQFAGEYCEYEATSTCINDGRWHKDHFCVNNGTCKSNSYPPRCDCQSGYYGDHCEYPLVPPISDDDDDDDDATYSVSAPIPLPDWATYYCGTSLPDAEKGCSVPCRTGEDIECIQEVGIQYKCFATTRCAQEFFNTWAPRSPSPTLSPRPTMLPTNLDFYCGRSFLDASSSCRVPCQSATDAECVRELGARFRCYYAPGCVVQNELSQGHSSSSPAQYPTTSTDSPLVLISHPVEVILTGLPLGYDLTADKASLAILLWFIEEKLQESFSKWNSDIAFEKVEIEGITPTNDGEVSVALAVSVKGTRGMSDYAGFYVMDAFNDQDFKEDLLETLKGENFRVFRDASVQIAPGQQVPAHSQLSERDALVSLYRGAGGSRWYRRDGWLSDLNICVWYGVKCNTESKVTSLSLSSNGMTGTLSDGFWGGLSHLESIIFDNNQLYGSIPANIGDLSLRKLKTLVLRKNRLRGMIPSGLGGLSMLEELDLRSNAFTRFQATEFEYRYSNLHWLLLDDNYLGGTLLYHVSTMKDLEVLSIRDNRVVGDIPQDFSSLANLTTLDLSYNDLTGTLPNLDFQYLNISIVGNRLASIHPDACLKSDWNNGNVGRYGCAGIGCPIGTANSEGRRTSASGPCLTCSSARYIGTVGCDMITPSPSPISVLTCGIDCLNGGVCSSNQLGNYNEWCDCPAGFWGTRCEFESVYYQPTPPPSRGTIPSFDNDCKLECQNGGVCQPGLIEYCRCPPGYEGMLCQVQYSRPTPPPYQRTKRPTPPPYYRTSRPSSPFYYFKPSPPPSSSTTSHHYWGSTDCLFYGTTVDGRLTSFPSFCGGGGGYADLLSGTVDIAVDPLTQKGIGQRGSSMYEFDIKDGSIGEKFAAKLKGVGSVKSVFNALEFANSKLYGVGFIDSGDTGSLSSNSNILYEMNAATMEIQARGPQFEVPIVGLAQSSNDMMYAISSCDNNNELYEIDLNVKQSQMICKELPVCIHSIAYHPQDDALYGGMSDGCIARILTDSCVVLGCDTKDAWHSHLDAVIAGLSVVCPLASNSPSMAKPPVSIPFSPSDERASLSKFYYATSGPRWFKNTNWLEDASKCIWHGISCDDAGNITKIDLAQNGLVGDTEALQYMSLLPHLRRLNLSNNRISGRIYSSSNFEALELESLDMGGNELSGTLPQKFLESSVESLQYLDLSRNSFTGYLGWGLLRTAGWDAVKWPSLKYLNLSSNSFSSSIPVEIGRSMLSLEYLDLSGNQFTFEFQESYYRELRNLTSLRLGRNNLVGELPSYEAVYYPRLRELDVSYNNMKGEIPTNLFNNDSIVNRILTLDISHNYFGLTFPSLELLRRLNVNAAGNMFEQIDEKACMNTEWNDGDVGRFSCNGLMCPPLTFNPLGRQASDNPCLPCDTAKFFGTTECIVITELPTQQPVSASIKYNDEEYDALVMFYKYTDGPSWTRSDNWLSDVSICEWYGVRCGDDGRVHALVLSSNKIKGPYDDRAQWLQQLPLLEVLGLSNNNFSGDASYGFFESCIGCNGRLRVIDLRNNLLSGKLPILSGSLERILLGNNSFSGTIPTNYYVALGELRELDLGANRLSGKLPSFRDLPFLKTFNVSMNSLTGIIPTDFLAASFGTPTIFAEPYTVDLSFNLLEGTLPAFEVDSLQINVAANRLIRLDEEICEDRPSWNKRGVHLYGCDAVACAVGSANTEGRQTSESTPCEPCPDAIYVGSIDCIGEDTSTTLKGCPDCQNGATCLPPPNDAEDVGYTCNCEAASTSSTWFEAYAGELCQYKATQFCSDNQHVAKYAFCANGGKCRKPEPTTWSRHPGCDCPEGFAGDHCEVPTAENQLSTEDLESLTNESSKLESISHPSSAPVELSKTFQLYQIPRFIMILTSKEAKALDSLPSLRDVEDVTSTFLLSIFEDDLGYDESVYVTTLDANEIDREELESNTNASQSDTVNITDTRRMQDDYNNFLTLDGIVGIRDGIFNGANQVEYFIAASLGRAFQSKGVLLEMMQAYPDPKLQSLTLVELSSEIEICPNGLKCHHGSQCAVSEDGSFACDCSVASSTYYEAIDGVQCEFAATHFCSNTAEMKKYAFCVNSGECGETNVTSGHPGCICSEPYEGFRCQLVNELRVERSTGPIYDEEEAQASNEGLSAGDYAIIAVICVGFILTTVIIVYKMVNISKTQLSPDERAPNEVSVSPAAEMEAGLGKKSVAEKVPSAEKSTAVGEIQQASEGALQPISPEDGSTNDIEERGIQHERSDYARDQASVVSVDTEYAVHSVPQESDIPDDGTQEEKEEIEPFHPDEDYTVCADVASQYTLSKDPDVAVGEIVDVAQTDKDDQTTEAQEDVVLTSDATAQEDISDETSDPQGPETSKATTDHIGDTDSSV